MQTLAKWMCLSLFLFIGTTAFAQDPEEIESEEVTATEEPEGGAIDDVVKKRNHG